MNGTSAARGIERALRAMFTDAAVRGWLHVAELPRYIAALTNDCTAPVTVDADEAVLMGSVYKLPLTVAYCRQVEAGVRRPTSGGALAAPRIAHRSRGADPHLVDETEDSRLPGVQSSVRCGPTALVPGSQQRPRQLMVSH